MDPARKLTPDQVLSEASLPAGMRDKHAIGVPPATLRDVLRAVHRLRLRGEATTLAAIAAASGLGRSTVVRALDVLTSEDVGLVVRQACRRNGKQAANHYSLLWTMLGGACADEALALFARRYGEAQGERAPSELSAVAAALSTVAGEQSTVAGRPRYSARGGKGGRCAPDCSIPEQEQEESSCSSFGAPDGAQSSAQPPPAETAATWDQARMVMIIAGVYAKGIDTLIGQFRANGGTPADAIALCRYKTENPDRLAINGGALRIALESWRKGLAHDCEGLWPQVPLEVEPEYRKPHDTDTDRERTLLHNDLAKAGWTRARISAELVRRGFAGLARPGESIVDELRRRLGAKRDD